MACSPLLQDLVHVVYGDGATGRALIDAGPAKIFFTGSGATGAKIMAQAAPPLIPVELELGGKDPMIVLDAPPPPPPTPRPPWRGPLGRSAGRERVGQRGAKTG